MSWSREAAANSGVASSPATKRDAFQAPKYSLIVGVMTVIAVNASEGVASNSFASASSSLRHLVEGGHRRDEELCVGQALAERDLAVAVHVLRRPLGEEARIGREQGGLGQVHEVARLLHDLAVRELEAERDRVLRVGGVRAGVDVHVVVGEPRDARDDPLHLLVGRIGGAVGLLPVGQELDHLVAVLLEHPRVVVVRLLRQRVVVLRHLLERRRVLRERRGVVGQIALDGVEVGGGGVLGRAGRAAVVVVVPASRHDGEGGQRGDYKGEPRDSRDHVLVLLARLLAGPVRAT